jgi:hypothetical protein
MKLLTCYREHFHVTSMYNSAHFLLYLLCNMRTAMNIVRVSLIWLVEVSNGEASGPLSKDCRLSRKLVSSSSQLVPRRPLKARPLVMLVFRASKNYPTFGLLIEPQCKWIAPNVFSRESWFSLWVSRNSASFKVLHTCWAAAMSMSHPVCDGGGHWKAGLPSLRKIQLLILILALFQWLFWRLIAKWAP